MVTTALLVVECELVSIQIYTGPSRAAGTLISVHLGSKVRWPRELKAQQLRKTQYMPIDKTQANQENIFTNFTTQTQYLKKIAINAYNTTKYINATNSTTTTQMSLGSKYRKHNQISESNHETVKTIRKLAC